MFYFHLVDRPIIHFVCCHLINSIDEQRTGANDVHRMMAGIYCMFRSSI